MADIVKLGDIEVNLDRVTYMKQYGPMIVLYFGGNQPLLLTPEESEELGNVLRGRDEGDSEIRG